MWPELKCPRCRRWCTLEPDTAHCAKCGCPLEADDFAELVALDRAASKECPRALALKPNDFEGIAALRSKYERLWSIPSTFRPSTKKF